MDAATAADIDAVILNFSPASLQILNMVLAIVMFSIALELKPDDFKRIAKAPKALLTGLFSQFLLLPALTFLIVIILELDRFRDPSDADKRGLLGQSIRANAQHFAANRD